MLVANGFPVHQSRAYFNPGFLNRIYVSETVLRVSPARSTLPVQFYLNEIVEAGTIESVPIRIGTTSSAPSLHFSKLDQELHHQHFVTPSSATADTGDGTDHDQTIRPRDAFPYEEIFEPAQLSRLQQFKSYLTRSFGLAHRVKHAPPAERLTLELRRTSDDKGWTLSV